MLHPSYSDLMKVVNSDCEPGEAKVVIQSLWLQAVVQDRLLPVTSLMLSREIKSL